MEYAAYIAALSSLVFAALVFYLYLKGRAAKNISAMLRMYPWKRRIKTGCLLLALPLFALAALGPTRGERSREVENEGADVLIALDVSRSMNAGDVAATRLERAKNAARWIADSLDGGRIGLIVFAGEAFLFCPMTADRGAFLMFLDAAGTDSVNLQGTDIGAVFNEAHRVFKKKPQNSKILVLITDGEDHEGTAFSAVEKFKELGVSVYCAGLGEDEGAFIAGADGNPVKTAKNASFLKKLAGAAGGSYFDISESFSGLRAVISAIDSHKKNHYGSRVLKEPIEYFAPFILPLIFLLALELLLPEIAMTSNAALPPPLRKFLKKYRSAE
jgi:Ca-activated chloride channel family protein